MWSCKRSITFALILYYTLRLQQEDHIPWIQTGWCGEIPNIPSRYEGERPLGGGCVPTSLITTGLFWLRDNLTACKISSWKGASVGRWIMCWKAEVDIRKLYKNLMIGISTASQTFTFVVSYTIGRIVQWPSFQVIVLLVLRTCVPNMLIVRSIPGSAWGWALNMFARVRMMMAPNVSILLMVDQWETTSVYWWTPLVPEIPDAMHQSAKS